MYRFAAGAVVVITIGHLAYLSLQEESRARTIVQRYFNDDPARDPGLLKSVRTSARISRAAAADGNIALRVHPAPGDEGDCSLPYIQMTYALYPQRVFVSDKSVVVNNGEDLNRLDFEPTQSWLANNDIRAIIDCNTSIGVNKFSVQRIATRGDGLPVD